jgi:hypothetical protein
LKTWQLGFIEEVCLSAISSACVAACGTSGPALPLQAPPAGQQIPWSTVKIISTMSTAFPGRQHGAGVMALQAWKLENFVYLHQWVRTMSTAVTSILHMPHLHQLVACDSQ